MDFITELVLSAVGSPWLFLALGLVCMIDAFFPPVPSETIVVGLASLSISTGTPVLWMVAVVAAIGAIVGDNIAYAIGRSIGVDRYSWMRRRRISAAFGWAQRSFQRRPATFILAGRYIPVGRIAVNMTAGATKFPVRRFVPLSVLAGVSWAVYSIAIGTLFGHWFEGQPLLGACIAIAGAIVIGLIVDRLAAFFRKRHAHRHHVHSGERKSEATGSVACSIHPELTETK